AEQTTATTVGGATVVRGIAVPAAGKSDTETEAFHDSEALDPLPFVDKVVVEDFSASSGAKGLVLTTWPADQTATLIQEETMLAQRNAPKELDGMLMVEDKITGRTSTQATSTSNVVSVQP
ncbi:unnamed protein product, partial [Amoebophrya sp. A25]